MNDGPPTPLEPSWGAVVLWILGRRKRVRIQGYSMSPTLRPGDHVLVDFGAFVRSLPSVGDVVLCRHPHEEGREIVKRVHALTETNFEVRGDNPDMSTDSREFGALPHALLVGRVVARFPD